MKHSATNSIQQHRSANLRTTHKHRMGKWELISLRALSRVRKSVVDVGTWSSRSRPSHHRGTETCSHSWSNRRVTIVVRNTPYNFSTPDCEVLFCAANNGCVLLHGCWLYPLAEIKAAMSSEWISKLTFGTEFMKIFLIVSLGYKIFLRTSTLIE